MESKGRKAQTHISTNISQLPPWLGLAACTHAFCLHKSYGPEEQEQLEVLRWLLQELDSTSHLPSLHTDFLRKK